MPLLIHWLLVIKQALETGKFLLLQQVLEVWDMHIYVILDYFC